MEKQGIVLLDKYELGHLLGQGTFAKVYHGKNLKTGQSVAIKMIHKEKVMRIGMMDQIKREISVMKRIKHPNVVELYEVMASKTKIYFVMEYIKGGELFNKVAKGKLSEEVARKYFQQLIGAIDFCHSRGVYHRDLKPENLLVDEDGNLKVSDFGLSALSESQKQDGLLHTTCGTPAYVAPEVICRKGYDGAKADLWSCGVVLYVLIAGYLPFHHSNIIEMYRKIRRAEFKFPSWFSVDVRKVLLRILDPKPNHRITVEKLMVHPWFMKGLKLVEYMEPQQEETETELGDVQAAFATTTEDDHPEIKKENIPEMKIEDNPETRMVIHSVKPTCLNAFDIISLSPGFNLSGMFQKENEQKAEVRFTIARSPNTIVSKLENAAKMESFEVTKKNGLLSFLGSKEGRKGHLSIDAEIFEVTPLFHMIEMKKTSGDTLEYQKFYNDDLRPSLKDIIWTWEGIAQQKELTPGQLPT
ncbi:hypothetical protein MKX01_018098 [Papaver californicum]|nr:hypothetical protein MKX01_018098 [Papaver californicum]